MESRPIFSREVSPVDDASHASERVRCSTRYQPYQRAQSPLNRDLPNWIRPEISGGPSRSITGRHIRVVPPASREWLLQHPPQAPFLLHWPIDLPQRPFVQEQDVSSSPFLPPVDSEGISGRATSVYSASAPSLPFPQSVAVVGSQKRYRASEASERRINCRPQHLTSTDNVWKKQRRVIIIPSADNIKSYLDNWVKHAQGRQEFKERVKIVQHVMQFLKNPKQTKLHLASKTLKQLPRIFHLAPFVQRLQRLDLQFPELETFPINICYLQALKELNIEHSNFKEIPSEIKLLQSLRALRLSHTKIERLPIELFTLTQLRTLNLSRTLIEEVPEAIGQLTELKLLDLGYTRIKKIPVAICQLSHLESLFCTETGITELPEKIGLLINLRALCLYDTRIELLPIGIRSLKKLDVLALNKTPLMRNCPYIKSWSVKEILAKNGSLHISPAAYIIQWGILNASIRRDTFSLLAKEHLHRLTSLLHPFLINRGSLNLFFKVKYEKEPAIDAGGPSRDYLGNILIEVIAQDQAEHGDMSLFVPVEKENGLYQLACHGLELSSKESALCWNLGIFLSAMMRGLGQNRDCKIGMIFSNRFYTQLFALSIKGGHLLDYRGQEPLVVLQKEKRACALIAQYDPNYMFYQYSLDRETWNKKQLNNLLMCLLADLDVPLEEQETHTTLVTALQNYLESENEVKAETNSIQAVLKHYQSYLDEKIREAAYAEYFSICKPLMVVANSFRQGSGHQDSKLTCFSNDPVRTVKDVSLFLQGHSVTRSSCIALMGRSSYTSEVEQQFKWIAESLGCESRGATEEQVSDMLACMTGAVAISNTLRLFFTSYNDPGSGVCYFHVCGKQADFPKSVLGLDKAEFLTYWYKELKDNRKMGFSVL